MRVQVGRLLLLCAFNLFICQQYILPLLLNSTAALDAVHLPGRALQPRVPEAATLRAGGCNRRCRRLQP